MKNALFIILIISNLNLNAQEKFLEDIQATQELSLKVTELFSVNKISKSFKSMDPYWPLPANEIEALKDKTMKYLNIIEERYGKSIGLLKVKNETIDDIAVRETYLIRYENTAIRLIFTYYKNDNGWIINSFKWDDSFEKEFK